MDIDACTDQNSDSIMLAGLGTTCPIQLIQFVEQGSHLSSGLVSSYEFQVVIISF